jgi:hypothetical protein
MATKRKKRRPRKTYRFQLTLGGIGGIAVVCFCLFVWMFLLGIWAGQTILLSAAPTVAAKKSSGLFSGNNSREKVQILVPEGKKKHVE